MSAAAAGLVLAGLLAAQPDAGAPRGSLDKEIIRRVIRRHINEVLWCYQQVLSRKPELGGRIMVQFTIGASGRVVASKLQSSTVNEPAVENCTVQAVGRWEFPKPLGGGEVTVSYPFTLKPAPRVQANLTPTAAGLRVGGGVEMVAVDGWTFVHRSTSAEGIPSNGLVFIADGGLLLVDTAWTEEQTKAILDWGDRALRRPWIGAVITHDHPDRDGGVGVLLRRQIPVAALDLTVAKLARRGVAGVTALFAARAGAFQDPRGFEAFYPGPGHASDNIVVAFPDRGVVFGGCLIKAADAPDLGFTGDADLASWPAAVRRVADRYPEPTVVPGHGAVDDKRASYAHTLDLLGRKK